jgi:hypothetical protein
MCGIRLRWNICSYLYVAGITAGLCVKLHQIEEKGDKKITTERNTV